MSATSYSFYVFLIGLVFLYYVIPLQRRYLVLLGGSVLFAAAASGKLVIYMLVTIISVYFGGLAIERAGKAKNKQKKRLIVTGMVIINLGMLIFLKYGGFLGENINQLLTLLGGQPLVPIMKLAMPVGISYYTLSAIGYIVDVYRKTIPAEHHFGRLALFVSFFFCLTEGPFTRYQQLSGQLSEGHRFNEKQFLFGLQLIMWGMFKKMVLADRAAMLVTTVFDNGNWQTAGGGEPVYGGLVIIVAVLFYTFEIYADFSGFIDMMRGSAVLFGITLEENFRRPFFSDSVGEFWRRWHMTLGAWFRDYIFYTVTLSKTNMNIGRWMRKHLGNFAGQFIPVAISLLCVWIATGIWHGAAWKYLAYGLYYYVIILIGMCLKRQIDGFYEKHVGLKENKGWHYFQVARTFLLVNMGMMLFRATDLTIFVKMLQAMAAPANVSILSLGMDAYDFVVIIIGAVVMLVVGILQERGMCIRERIDEIPMPVRWSVYLGAIVIIVVFGAYGTNYGAIDPIYANF